MTDDAEGAGKSIAQDAESPVEAAARVAIQARGVLSGLTDGMRPYSDVIADWMAARNSAIADQQRFATALIGEDPTVRAAHEISDAVVRLLEQGVRQAEIGQRQEAGIDVVVQELRAARASNDRIARISIAIATVSAVVAAMSTVATIVALFQ